MDELLNKRACDFVRAHFDALNQSDASAATAGLFHPKSMSRQPLDQYVREMMALAPFRVVDLEVESTEPPRPKRHGTVGTIWVKAKVEVANAKVREESLPVWWNPTDGTMTLAVRLSHWLE